MTDDFNPIEWITTKEAADLIEYDVSHADPGGALKICS